MEQCVVLFDSTGDVIKVVRCSIEAYASEHGYEIQWGRDNIGGQLAKGGRYRSFIVSTLEDK